MKKNIAEHMRDIMLEKGINIVWYGGLDEIHECARRVGMYEDSYKGNTHPLAVNRKILAALDRSNLFQKVYIKHIGRPARAFKLIKSSCGGYYNV